MAYKSDDRQFRSLDDTEEQEFRAYAQHNDPPDLQQWNIYHPVCRDEWIKRGITPEKQQV